MKNRLFRALGLFGILVSLYFVTYTGQFISTDEIILLDAAHSFYFYHNLDLTYSTNLRPFVTLPPDRVGASLDSEPLQAYFSAPLLWIAAHVPGIGMVQTTLLINVFLTALTAVVLYYYGVALGYTDATALTIALVFGTATIAWPYSRFYFREPLFTLMALTGAYALERWRAKIEAGHIRPNLLLLAGGALVLAFLSKEASLLVLPTLLIIAFPHFQINRRTVIELGIGLMLVLIAILIALITGIASRSL
ncbi:MAG TPA: hypothetical protein VMT24_12320, partial [Aggregatilineaceae bacterium]|nr:hypothetical protein [Aggregatilineaceae bacterium]